MTRDNAWELVRVVLTEKNVDVKKALKVNEKDRFRVSLGLFCEFTFTEENKQLTARSCMLRLPNPPMKELLNDLPRLTEEFVEFLPEGSYFDFDSSALEVDPYQAFRINLRKEYYEVVDKPAFVKEIEELNKAAKVWTELYYKESVENIKRGRK